MTQSGTVGATQVPKAPPDRDAAEGLARHRRIRVAIFTNSVAIGGMEKHTELIARELDRSVAEVYAICPRWDATEPWAIEFTQAADHSARIAPDRRYGWRGMARDMYRLWRQLRHWRVDVMHMHLTSYTGGVAAALIARLAGVKVLVCTEHLAPEEPLSWPRRVEHNLFSRNLNRIICVSEENRKARARYLFTPAAKTTVVNNGIDPSPFSESSPAAQLQLRADLGIPAEAPIVGTVVRFVEEKGLNYLLDAMPKVLAAVPDAYLLMVGDGALRGELERQAEALGIRDRVVFAGFQADPRPYLSLMNAFVLPVPFGSASIGLLEAMAMRRAVVVTFGGEGEPVIDGETGLYAAPRNPDALADAILRIVSDPHYERALGERARERIEAAFSSHGVASQLAVVYADEARKATRATTTRTPTLPAESGSRRASTD